MAADDVPLNAPVPRRLHAELKGWVGLKGTTIRRFVVEAIEEKLARDKAADGRGGARRR